MSYLDNHRDDLRELFQALDRNQDWTDDEAELVRYMERHWLGVEHGPGADKETFDSAAVDRAWPLLRRLGVVDRLNPPRTSYDHVIVMGAAGIGLHRRMELVRSSGVTSPVMTILAGMRPHSGLARDGGIDELLHTAGRFGAASAEWTPPAELVRVQRLLGDVDPLVAAQVAFASETDLARLLLTKQWPMARLMGATFATDPGTPNELGPRRLLFEEYAVDSHIGVIRLLNGAAVRRDHDGVPRPPRPTSRSTIREWVDLEGASLDGASVLAVVNQPHLARVRLDVGAELRELGRSDVSLDTAGCEALRDSADLNLLLGEIPARINAERLSQPS